MRSSPTWPASCPACTPASAARARRPDDDPHRHRPAERADHRCPARRHLRHHRARPVPGLRRDAAGQHRARRADRARRLPGPGTDPARRPGPAGHDPDRRAGAVRVRAAAAPLAARAADVQGTGAGAADHVRALDHRPEHLHPDLLRRHPVAAGLLRDVVPGLRQPADPGHVPDLVRHRARAVGRRAPDAAADRAWPGDPGQLRGLGHGGRTRRQRHPGPDVRVRPRRRLRGGWRGARRPHLRLHPDLGDHLPAHRVRGRGPGRPGIGQGHAHRGDPARCHRERRRRVLRRRVPRSHRFRRVSRRPVGAAAGPVRAGGHLVTRRGVLRAGVALLALIAAALVPGYTGQYGLLVAFEIVQLAALAQAWSLLAGFGGIVSLAVAAFVGVGSYGAAEAAAKAGWGLLPSILAGGLVAVVFALIVAVPMLRFRGLYFTIGSLVLAEALGIFMSNFSGFGGNAGITLPGTAPSQQAIYLYSLAVAAAATLAVAWMMRSRLGLGLRAIRDDEDVAERVGVLAFRTKLAAFLVSSLVMGIVGGIQAQWTGYVEPAGSFALDWTVETVNAAIIGGVGTIVGPLAGSGISVGLSQGLSGYPTVHLIILGALLIIVIRLAPGGLWGAFCQLAPVLRRRVWPRREGAPAARGTDAGADAGSAGA